MTVYGRRPGRNTVPEPSPESSSARPGPLLSQRAVLILITALIIGTTTGVLTYLAGKLIVDAILAGGAAFGTAVPVLHKLID
jgi:hypothetical protein